MELGREKPQASSHQTPEPQNTAPPTVVVGVICPGQTLLQNPPKAKLFGYIPPPPNLKDIPRRVLELGKQEKVQKRNS